MHFYFYGGKQYASIQQTLQMKKQSQDDISFSLIISDVCDYILIFFANVKSYHFWSWSDLIILKNQYL